MSSPRLALLLVVAVLLLCTACSKKEESAASDKAPVEKRVCDNLLEHTRKLPGFADTVGDEAKCATEVATLRTECTNGDEVLECLATMKGETEEEFGTAFVDCITACKPANQGRKLPDHPSHEGHDH